MIDKIPQAASRNNTEIRNPTGINQVSYDYSSFHKCHYCNGSGSFSVLGFNCTGKVVESNFPCSYCNAGQKES